MSYNEIPDILIEIPKERCLATLSSLPRLMKCRLEVFTHSDHLNGTSMIILVTFTLDVVHRVRIHTGNINEIPSCQLGIAFNLSTLGQWHDTSCPKATSLSTIPIGIILIFVFRFLTAAALFWLSSRFRSGSDVIVQTDSPDDMLCVHIELAV